MKISSLVCEYNPFHNGHALMLKKMRENGATHIVAVMSGNFTQRAEPALFDKYTRTKAALQNGVDLVIELPVSFACSYAERFAFGGVSIINALGCVDELCFGSECGNSSLLTSLAKAVCSEEISEAIKKYLKGGLSFAAARQKSIEEIYGTDIADLLSHPNDILAVEYIKAVKKLNSDLSIKTFKRIGAAHDSFDFTENIASASYIRELYFKKENYQEFIPKNTHSIYETAENQPFSSGRLSALETAILYKLRTMSLNELGELPEIGEGLHHRFYRAIQKGRSISEIADSVKTKRYTMTRIKRCMLYALLGFTKSGFMPSPVYIKILGFNHKGREVLREMRNTAKLPVIMKYRDCSDFSEEVEKMFIEETKCDDIFYLTGEKIEPCGKNCVSNLIIL